MKATRKFTSLTFKAETKQDLEVLDKLPDQLKGFITTYVEKDKPVTKKK